ncbi:MAG: IPT/TIG domain-containing protein, partial [Bacillota bacterium]
MNKRNKWIVLVFLLVAAWSVASPAIAADYSIIQENDAAFIYSGTWSTPSYGDGSASGGNYKYTNAKDATVTATIYGTGFQWIARPSSDSGIAEVTVDGKVEARVDLYNPNTIYQQIVFQKTPLTRGTHTVVIKVTGDKNQNSSGTYVTIDAFKVIDTEDKTPPLPPSGVQVTGSNGLIDLTWQANTSDADLEGYNVYRSTTPDAGFVKVNRWLIKTSTTFRDSAVNNGIYYYYMVTSVDNVGNESAGSTLVSGLPALYGGMYEEGSAGLSYQGNWSNAYGDNRASGGNYYYSYTKDATISFSVYGTGIRVIGLPTTSSGIAEFTVDGVVEARVDLYNPYSLYQQIIFQKAPLTRGVHNVTIRVTGDKNQSSGGTYLHIDAIKVIDSDDKLPPLPPKSLNVAVSDRRVELFWPANTDTDLEGYNVYRSTLPDSGFIRLNQWLIKSSTTFIDAPPLNGTTYYYIVTAMDTVGNESAGSPVTPALPAMYPGRHEEWSAGMAYQGTWYNWGDSRHSAGNLKYASTVGNSVTAKVYGTGVRLIVTKRSDA